MPGDGMVRRKDEGASAKIEGGAHQHRRNAAKAIEERLGDPAAEERHADRQPAHQDGCGAERGSELDQACFNPRSSGHSRNSYSANVTTPQYWRATNFAIIKG